MNIIAEGKLPENRTIRSCVTIVDVYGRPIHKVAIEQSLPQKNLETMDTWPIVNAQYVDM